MANYAKTLKTSFRQIKKVPDLILSTLLLSETDIGSKRFFAK